jgi:hypothetical protein
MGELRPIGDEFILPGSKLLLKTAAGVMPVVVDEIRETGYVLSDRTSGLGFHQSYDEGAEAMMTGPKNIRVAIELPLPSMGNSLVRVDGTSWVTYVLLADEIESEKPVSDILRSNMSDEVKQKEIIRVITEYVLEHVGEDDYTVINSTEWGDVRVSDQEIAKLIRDWNERNAEEAEYRSTEPIIPETPPTATASGGPDTKLVARIVGADKNEWSVPSGGHYWITPGGELIKCSKHSAWIRRNYKKYPELRKYAATIEQADDLSGIGQVVVDAGWLQCGIEEYGTDYAYAHVRAIDNRTDIDRFDNALGKYFRAVKAVELYSSNGDTMTLEPDEIEIAGGLWNAIQARRGPNSIVKRYHEGSAKTAQQMGKPLNQMPLHEIAWLIERDWGTVNFGAKPYLDAMKHMKSMRDMYGADDAASIVSYFIANAGTWRGETARIVKNYLRRLIQMSYQASISVKGSYIKAKSEKGEIAKGIEVEKEHSDTIEWAEKHPDATVEEVAKRIAEDHVGEIPDYYTRLKKMEDGAPKTAVTGLKAGDHVRCTVKKPVYNTTMCTGVVVTQPTTLFWEDDHSDNTHQKTFVKWSDTGEVNAVPNGWLVKMKDPGYITADVGRGELDLKDTTEHRLDDVLQKLTNSGVDAKYNGSFGNFPIIEGRLTTGQNFRVYARTLGTGIVRDGPSVYEGGEEHAVLETAIWTTSEDVKYYGGFAKPSAGSFEEGIAIITGVKRNG